MDIPYAENSKPHISTLPFIPDYPPSLQGKNELFEDFLVSLDKNYFRAYNKFSFVFGTSEVSPFQYQNYKTKTVFS